MSLWDLGVMRRESHRGAAGLWLRALVWGCPALGSCSHGLGLLLWDMLGSEDFGSQKQRGELSLAGVLGERAPFGVSFSQEQCTSQYTPWVRELFEVP